MCGEEDVRVSGKGRHLHWGRRRLAEAAADSTEGGGEKLVEESEGW